MTTQARLTGEGTRREPAVVVREAGWVLGARAGSPGTFTALPLPLSTKTELPAPYGPWMDIAHELPQLIMSHQLRSRVHQVWCSLSCLWSSLKAWSDTAVSVKRVEKQPSSTDVC